MALWKINLYKCNECIILLQQQINVLTYKQRYKSNDFGIINEIFIAHETMECTNSGFFHSQNHFHSARDEMLKGNPWKHLNRTNCNGLTLTLHAAYTPDRLIYQLNGKENRRKLNQKQQTLYYFMPYYWYLYCNSVFASKNQSTKNPSFSS